jgi:hypothetical protein
VVAIDLEAPGQRGRAPVELLVEVVADAADGLRDEQRGRGGVEEARHVGARAAQAPDPGRRPQGDPAPDPQPPFQTANGPHQWSGTSFQLVARK